MQLKYQKPLSIRSWDDIQRYIKLDETHESIVLDFKEDIPLKNPDSAKETARDIAQFANTWGGCLLVGVEETLSQQGYKTASKFCGVKDSESLKAFLHTKVVNYLYPSTISFKDVIITDKTFPPLFAINVDPIENGLVAVWKRGDSNAIEYLYRTEYGKDYLKPAEVEEKLMDKMRPIILRLNRLFEQCRASGQGSYPLVHLSSPLEGVSQSDYGEVVRLREIRQSEIILAYKESPFSVPFGLIRDVWETIDNKIGLVINATIVVPSASKKPIWLRAF